MPTSSSIPAWVPPANAVRAQFASRPTLQDVTQQMLGDAITEKYPSLRLDLSRVRLATPRPGGGWELSMLMPLVLDYLANGTPIDLSPIDHQHYFLSDEAGNWLEPADGNLDMQVIETLIQELPWSVPIGLQNALNDYWAGNADTGVSRWRWLSDVLNAVTQGQGLRYALVAMMCMLLPGLWAFLRALEFYPGAYHRLHVPTAAAA